MITKLKTSYDWFQPFHICCVRVYVKVLFRLKIFLKQKPSFVVSLCFACSPLIVFPFVFFHSNALIFQMENLIAGKNHSRLFIIMKIISFVFVLFFCFWSTKKYANSFIYNADRKMLAISINKTTWFQNQFQAKLKLNSLRKQSKIYNIKCVYTAHIVIGIGNCLTWTRENKDVDCNDSILSEIVVTPVYSMHELLS